MTHKTEHKTKQRLLKPVKIKFTYVIAVVALIFIVWYFLGRGGPKQDYTEFAQCLTEEGAVMYGTYWCSHCKAQKEDFGDSFQYVNYVECTEDKLKCVENGIEGFPTWIIDGRKYPGVQPMERLALLTQCELPE
jgi:hypothetical protein